MDSETYTGADADSGPSSLLLLILAVATGALVANLYYAQPLAASIAPAIGISPNLAGSVVSVTQVGYGVGLFFLVSLADLVESKRLVLASLVVTTGALAAAALSTRPLPFFLASFLIGTCSSGAQVLLPFVAHLVPAARRGRAVGNVMAGVLSGIMLARPAALFIAGSLGWRAVFWCSAGLMVAVGLGLAWAMPRHEPRGGVHYGRILASTAGLLRNSPVLRRRAAYQALLFSAFNMFWTAVPIMLAQRFELGEHGIALFALAGAGGALAAPVVGRLADAGFSRVLTAASMVLLALSFLGTASPTGVAVLALLAVTIDGAVQTNQVVSQRIIFAVAPELRGRANAVYMTSLFAGGAIGSVLATLVYDRWGWQAVAFLGTATGALALSLFSTDPDVRGTGAKR